MFYIILTALKYITLIKGDKKTLSKLFFLEVSHVKSHGVSLLFESFVFGFQNQTS